MTQTHIEIHQSYTHTPTNTHTHTYTHTYSSHQQVQLSEVESLHRQPHCSTIEKQNIFYTSTQGHCLGLHLMDQIGHTFRNFVFSLFSFTFVTQKFEHQNNSEGISEAFMSSKIKIEMRVSLHFNL